MKNLFTTLGIVLALCACSPRPVNEAATTPAIDVTQITSQIESNNAAIERSKKILAQMDRVAAVEKRVADTQQQLRDLGSPQYPSAFDQEQMAREKKEREELLVRVDQLTQSNKLLAAKLQPK